MLKKFIGLRKRYGQNWVTFFSDNNTEIPWRRLTLQEFYYYDNLFRENKYPEVILEEEIFALTVLEPLYIENMDELPAGLITAVVSNILSASGPLSVQQIENDLNIARHATQDFVSSSVTLVCTVFPAYKPEDVLNLEYETFMKRLAMAESRLLSVGFLKEPLSVLGGVKQQVQQEKPSVRKRRELMEQQKVISSKLKDLNSKDKTIQTNMPEGIVNTSSAISGSQFYVPDLSNDPRDKALNDLKVAKARKEAVDGLEAIYPEYFKALKEGKKITPEFIQSVKGSTPQEVKENHEEYVKKVISGEIQVQPTTEVKRPSVKPHPGKIKVKRR